MSGDTRSSLRLHVPFGFVEHLVGARKVGDAVLARPVLDPAIESLDVRGCVVERQVRRLERVVVSDGSLGRDVCPASPRLATDVSSRRRN
jgi:hypothetical protein